MNVDEITQQIKRERAEKLLAKAQQRPTGSRWTNSEGSTATVVGFDCDLEEAWLLDDDEHGSQGLLLLSEFDDNPSDVTPAAADTAIAEQARTLARGRGVPQHATLWDTPTGADQILAAIAFHDAGYAQLEAERAANRAREQRSIAIATVVGHCGGNQSAAARLLGMDQSRVSRAVASIEYVP